VVAAVANGPRGLLFLSRFEQFLRALADEGVFEGKMVQSIFARRLLGPESFRFCRKFCEMSMQAVADLLQVDRRTVQRWESEESPVPPWAMLLVSKMADERSKGRAVMRTWLTELADEEARPTEIDLDVA